MELATAGSYIGKGPGSKGLSVDKEVGYTRLMARHKNFLELL